MYLSSRILYFICVAREHWEHDRSFGLVPRSQPQNRPYASGWTWWMFSQTPELCNTIESAWIKIHVKHFQHCVESIDASKNMSYVVSEENKNRYQFNPCNKKYLVLDKKKSQKYKQCIKTSIAVLNLKITLCRNLIKIVKRLNFFFRFIAQYQMNSSTKAQCFLIYLFFASCANEVTLNCRFVTAGDQELQKVRYSRLNKSVMNLLFNEEMKK